MAIFPGFYTVTEAATYLGRSHAQVTRYVSQGLIKAEKQGNQWFIPENEVVNFKPPLRGNPEFREKSRQSEK